MPTKIIVTKKDIFSLNSEVIACPINCKGVMGKGLALQFKRRYPEIEASYKAFCKDKVITPTSGGIVYTKAKEFPRIIWLLPTKDHWEEKSNLYNILEVVRKFCYEIQVFEKIGGQAYNEVSLPKVGCGLGGLDWEEVKQALIDTIQPYELETPFVFTEYP